MKKTVFAALSLACVLLAGCSEQGGNPQPGNAGGTSTQSSVAESTQTSSGESSEQSSVPELSAEQSTESGSVEKRPGYKSHELAFPVNDIGKTENNAHIYEVEPFELMIDLPEGWKIAESKDSNRYAVMQDDKLIADIGYDIYPSGRYDDSSNGEIDETQSDAYRQIYNQLMLGSVVNWDCDYKEVNTIGNTIASTCRIMVKDVPEDEYAHGILARNKPLGVYVNININDASIPADTVDYIAKTIEIK